MYIKSNFMYAYRPIVSFVGSVTSFQILYCYNCDKWWLSATVISSF